MFQMPMLGVELKKAGAIQGTQRVCETAGGAPVPRHHTTGISPVIKARYRTGPVPRGGAGLGPSGCSKGPGGATLRDPGHTALPQGLLRAAAGRGERALPDVLKDSGAVLPVVAAHRDAAPQPVGSDLVGEKAGA